MINYQAFEYCLNHFLAQSDIDTNDEDGSIGKKINLFDV